MLASQYIGIMLTKFGVNYLFLLGEYEFIYSLIFPENDIKKKIAGVLLVVANECKLESCPAWLEQFMYQVWCL